MSEPLIPSTVFYPGDGAPVLGDVLANVPDEKAIGLVFYYDPAKGETAHAKYLSANQDAMRIARASWFHPQQLAPRFTQERDGVIAIDVPLKSADELRSRDIFLFVLLAALGHGAYL